VNQSDVRDVVADAVKSVAALYWKSTFNSDDHAALMSLEIDLSTILTKLNQDDLVSRTEEFTAAAALMRTSVLPAIKKLDASVERLIKIEGDFKSTMNDLMKVSQSVSFFKIPGI
jgi:hypothetical protein